MIEVKNISKIFNQNRPNEVCALKDVDLNFEQGSLTILKGSSGGGKSTLLALIAALSKPTEGEVIVDQHRVSKLPDNFSALYRRQNIGFIFQKFNLIPSLNVFDNIVAPLLPDNLETKVLQRQAEAVMDRFSITHKISTSVKNLSGGEQQRVAICRALINSPKIILADEPTANLDAFLTENFLEFIRQMRNENKTIIIATHDPVFFDLDFTDQEVTIKNGQLA